VRLVNDLGQLPAPRFLWLGQLDTLWLSCGGEGTIPLEWLEQRA
jgi:hypothetical protein